MKKVFALVFAFVVLLGITVLGFTLKKDGKEETYLRVHIRANSNQQEDQTVKYSVKAAVVDYLTPLLSNGKTFNQAYNIINDNLSNIEAVADKVLKENGFSYKSQAILNEEYFPTRSYGEYTLENGYYDALILNLGTGEGNNWWCVVYPPLCFIGKEGNDTNNIRYKSKLVEIIKKFFSA